MPGTIQSFFATIDPVSPPPQQLRDLALRPNRSHLDETFKLKLLRWRRRVLPPGLPAVRSEFQRHRLATSGAYAPPMAKDRLPSRRHFLFDAFSSREPASTSLENALASERPRT